MCRSGLEALDLFGILGDLDLGRNYFFLAVELRFIIFYERDSNRFFLFFISGEAIICYQCNSEYDPRCGDPFDSYTLGTVNCSFQPRLEHLSHLEPTLCRKISQRGEATFISSFVFTTVHSIEKFNQILSKKGFN